MGLHLLGHLLGLGQGDRRSSLSTSSGADAVFAALADPTRRALLDRLSRVGPQNATELGRHEPMSRQAVAKHLASLEAAGLVTSLRQGREVRYELVTERVAGASAWLDDVGTRWDRRLKALQRHLDPG